jgi:hypothetical protein
VVEVTRLFTGGVPDLIPGPPLGPRPQVDPTRSFVETVSSYPQSVELEASQTFLPSPAGVSLTPNPLAGLFGTAPQGTELYHYSLVRLPDVPMKPRLNDERVGFFSTRQSDYGSRQQRVARREFINRWRLECSDQREGDLCVPRKPITYYVDPATPTWIVPWVKRGIEEWQPAFAAAGFRQGIVAREVPRDSVGILRGENANVSMVRWLPSAVENAVGPSTVDPRSGEILDADVQMYHNVMNLNRSWYFSQVAHLDPRAQKLPFPDSLMGAWCSSWWRTRWGTRSASAQHEGELAVPARLGPQPLVGGAHGPQPEHHGLRRYNYVAQPEDSIPLELLVPRVGPYDVYAVKWGYSADRRHARGGEAHARRVGEHAGHRAVVPLRRRRERGGRRPG